MGATATFPCVKEVLQRWWVALWRGRYGRRCLRLFRPLRCTTELTTAPSYCVRTNGGFGVGFYSRLLPWWPSDAAAVLEMPQDSSESCRVTPRTEFHAVAYDVLVGTCLELWENAPELEKGLPSGFQSVCGVVNYDKLSNDERWWYVVYNMWSLRPVYLLKFATAATADKDPLHGHPSGAADGGMPNAERAGTQSSSFAEGPVQAPLLKARRPAPALVYPT
eukprot:NODE_2641_length_761_cov_309.709270_g1851_i0.p1 GENE.NODE_2641_length_761_cov_309.709270_g1851_i0~~NODE_2641_length_761_cov_309.709270_g1851_i0.p1  ORF type:complete len:232 (+),score=43.50 NODE_2641_length_761_cov_309.709270_g1851_i0:35-697(+)